MVDRPLLDGPVSDIVSFAMFILLCLACIIGTVFLFV
jgi:hypothetical protein